MTMKPRPRQLVLEDRDAAYHQWEAELTDPTWKPVPAGPRIAPTGLELLTGDMQERYDGLPQRGTPRKKRR
jgi:hypothetical protein